VYASGLARPIQACFSTLIKSDIWTIPKRECFSTFTNITPNSELNAYLVTDRIEFSEIGREMKLLKSNIVSSQ
jgi:hypothetical protein